MRSCDWSKPIPDWYQAEEGVPGVVTPPAVEPPQPEVTPPGTEFPFEPLFLILRSTGDRMRWINDEVWILPASDAYAAWYRDPVRLGSIEKIVATFFVKHDELRQKIIDAYRERVSAIKETRGIDLAHRLARDRFTLRGGDWDGIRDDNEIQQSWSAWTNTYSQSK